MTVDPNKVPSSADGKLQMYADNDRHDDKHLFRTRRLWQSTSFLYAILLALLVIIGTAVLAIILTRRNTCRQLQEERIGASLGLLPKDTTVPWVPCVKTIKSSSCVCPASFIHSPFNPSHCILSHSRCLQSCTNNPHCTCHNLVDADRCRETTRHWSGEELKIGAVERVQHTKEKNILQFPWSDHSSRLIEHSLVNIKSGERLFFSADRRTGITIHEEDDDYLLNERWSKIEPNTTEQHIVYTQLDPQTHTCRMSSILDEGSVTHGPIHTCPGSTIAAPYFFGITCQDILVLWYGDRQLKTHRQEGWAVSRHHFESVIPRLPVLLDPFHRYYSLYDDSMIEIKNLNGEVLAQIFTDISMPTKFEFVDQYGTMRIANHTHMQLISSKNEEAWLDV